MEKNSIKIKTYEQASRILNGYEETRPYLQSLIQNKVSNSEIILDTADFIYLKHWGRKIKGTAQKILKSNSIMQNIQKLKNLEDKTEKEFLEERICIQLDNVRENLGAYLVKQYNLAKSN